jgi:hypothetical protein
MAVGRVYRTKTSSSSSCKALQPLVGPALLNSFIPSSSIHGKPSPYLDLHNLYILHDTVSHFIFGLPLNMDRTYTVETIGGR